MEDADFAIDGFTFSGECCIIDYVCVKHWLSACLLFVVYMCVLGLDSREERLVACTGVATDHSESSRGDEEPRV